MPTARSPSADISADNIVGSPDAPRLTRQHSAAYISAMRTTSIRQEIRYDPAAQVGRTAWKKTASRKTRKRVRFAAELMPRMSNDPSDTGSNPDPDPDSSDSRSDSSDKENAVPTSSSQDSQPRARTPLGELDISDFAAPSIENADSATPTRPALTELSPEEAPTTIPASPSRGTLAATRGRIYGPRDKPSPPHTQTTPQPQPPRTPSPPGDPLAESEVTLPLPESAHHPRIVLHPPSYPKSPTSPPPKLSPRSRVDPYRKMNERRFQPYCDRNLRVRTDPLGRYWEDGITYAEWSKRKREREGSVARLCGEDEGWERREEEKGQCVVTLPTSSDEASSSVDASVNSSSHTRKGRITERQARQQRRLQEERRKRAVTLPAPSDQGSSSVAASVNSRPYRRFWDIRRMSEQQARQQRRLQEERRKKPIKLPTSSDDGCSNRNVDSSSHSRMTETTPLVQDLMRRLKSRQDNAQGSHKGEGVWRRKTPHVVEGTPTRGPDSGLPRHHRAWIPRQWVRDVGNRGRGANQDREPSRKQQEETSPIAGVGSQRDDRSAPRGRTSDRNRGRSATRDRGPGKGQQTQTPGTAGADS
ncbi:MAG: hypothetical protein LQ343_007987 [Gyalolechia ehrenbergii]|nr:MAG: hypothetical protein LQ343_007987 [Gyalolechia ehrenbergii]